MIEPTAGEPKVGRDVLRFEIRQLFEDLLLSESSGKQVQNIDHTNPHPTDAGPPSALCKIGIDTLDEFSHDVELLGRPFPLHPTFVRLRSARSWACSMVMPQCACVPLF